MDDQPHLKKPKPSPPQSLLLTSVLGPLTSASSPLPPISTGFPALDAALHGGLPRGGLTEIFGPSGSGKSTVALSLIVSVISSGGSALLLDCDGSFHPARFLQLVSSRGCDQSTALNNLHVARCTSWEALVSGVAHTVLATMREHAAQLLIVDSVAFLFRTAEGRAVSKRLETFAMRLQDAAVETRASVVIVNHAKSMRDGGAVFPAMGEAWQHVCATRLCLAWNERTNRFIEIMKSPMVKRTRVRFEIHENGLVLPEDD